MHLRSGKMYAEPLNKKNKTWLSSVDILYISAWLILPLQKDYKKHLSAIRIGRYQEYKWLLLFDINKNLEWAANFSKIMVSTVIMTTV